MSHGIAEQRLSFQPSYLPPNVLTLRQRVLARQTQLLINKTEIAREILSDPQFAEKFQTARAVVLKSRRHDHDLCSEVTQEALRSLHQYFVSRGVLEYSDRGEDAFGGWLFVLCKRHLVWACQRLARQRQHRSRHHDFLHDVPSTSRTVSERHYSEALALVTRAIRQMAQPLQGVMWDDLQGVSCEESARLRGISRNYVAILRTKGRAILKDILADQMTPLLS